VSETPVGNTETMNCAAPPVPAETPNPAPKKKNGGARPGAGRPPGPRKRGRPPGRTKIKDATLAKMWASRDIAIEAENDDDGIKEFFSKLYRSPNVDLALRVTAARELAPYVLSKSPTLSVVAEANLSEQHLDAVANFGKGGSSKGKASASEPELITAKAKAPTPKAKALTTNPKPIAPQPEPIVVRPAVEG